jgi:KilA-N domain
MKSSIISKDYLGSRIRINQDSKLVCLTDICKAVGKKFAGWYRRGDTQPFLDLLSLEVQICTSSLLIVGKGKKLTWGHPQVSIDVAIWCSTEMRVKVTGWILELFTTGKVELNPSPISLVVISTDDIERMHNAGHSVASRGFSEAKGKDKAAPPDGWLTIAEHMRVIESDRDAARELGFSQWCCRQISDLYRTNTGLEPPKVPSKRGGVFCYPPEYSEVIASHYYSWKATHMEVLAANELRLATSHKQCEMFDLFPDSEAA